MRHIRFITTFALLAALSLPFAGCAAYVGRPFPVAAVKQIEIGKTTREDIRRQFGQPWRTGIEDGRKTWTYGQYSRTLTRDLVVRFDDRGVVVSYSFSSSAPEDENL